MKKELRSKRLVPAAMIHDGYEMTMDVRIYRERPEVARHVRPEVARLWGYLSQTCGD